MPLFFAPSGGKVVGTLARVGSSWWVVCALCLGAASARGEDPAAKPAPAATGASPATTPASGAPAAQAPASTPKAANGLPTLPPPGAPQELPLSLQEAVSLAIENNLDVQISRYDPLIAYEQHVAAWGAYDPRASGQFGYRDDEIPVSSVLQGSSNVLVEKEYAGSAGVAGLLPLIGWSYSLDYTGAGLRTTSPINDLSPEYSAGLSGKITAPLLKGFLWGEPWVFVKSTRIAASSSLDEFSRSLMDTVESTERAYWQLVAQEERLRVANKSLETALTLREQTGAQYDVGVVSRVEVVEADAGVAAREFDRITAENLYRGSQDQLIDIVLGPNLTPDSQLEIRPTSHPDVVHYDVDAEEATARALELRPEIALARAAIDQQELQLKFAKNQRLPQLDAVGTYGYRGLAGATNPVPGFNGGARPPTALEHTYPHTDDDFFTAKGARQWSLGGVLSFPIGKVGERADVRRAELELRRAETGLRRTEQQIIVEIRAAVRNLRSAQEGIAAAESRRVATEEQLRAERIRLEHGESTPFDVLQRESDLVDAESQKIAALQVYRNSLAALDRAQGTILRDRNIVVEEARTLR